MYMASLKSTHRYYILSALRYVQYREHQRIVETAEGSFPAIGSLVLSNVTMSGRLCLLPCRQTITATYTYNVWHSNITTAFAGESVNFSAREVSRGVHSPVH